MSYVIELLGAEKTAAFLDDVWIGSCSPWFWQAAVSCDLALGRDETIVRLGFK